MGDFVKLIGSCRSWKVEKAVGTNEIRQKLAAEFAGNRHRKMVAVPVVGSHQIEAVGSIGAAIAAISFRKD